MSMNVICTVIDDKCVEELGLLRKSLYLSGWNDTLYVFVPGNGDITLPSGCTAIKFNPWWNSKLNTANTVAMAKPDIFLHWIGKCDNVLYVDGSDVLFFENPSVLFSLFDSSKTAITAACHGHDKSGKAAQAKGLEPANELQQTLYNALGELASEIQTNYNDGVVLFKPNDHRAQLALHLWKLILTHIPFIGSLRTSNKKTVRNIAGIQVGYNLVVRILKSQNAFMEIPYSWNVRGISDDVEYSYHSCIKPGFGKVNIGHWAGGGGFPPSIMKYIKKAKL